MTAGEILEQFSAKTALVVGDICLDRWCTYDPEFSEPSRETGIPRIAVVSTELTPGAGGTVANNLAALGIGRVAVLGAVSTDGFGKELMQALARRGISAELLVCSDDVATFTYTKLINSATGKEDQPRVDFINIRHLPEPVERQVLSNLRTFGLAFDVIFVSDQAETQRGGIVTPAMRNMLAELAAVEPGKIIWVDSRVRSELFRNVILKPNQDEAERASTALFGAVDYRRLRESVSAKALFITQGERGVAVVDAEGEQFVPGRSIAEPVDICGAGDSFSAGAGIALAISGSPVDAARFGNLVASITVMKPGTGTASPEEVRAAATELGW
jgi:rfaE bifunctional protein kinase chain/domain